MVRLHALELGHNMLLPELQVTASTPTPCPASTPPSPPPTALAHAPTPLAPAPTPLAPTPTTF